MDKPTIRRKITIWLIRILLIGSIYTGLLFLLSAVLFANWHETEGTQLPAKNSLSPSRAASESILSLKEEIPATPSNPIECSVQPELLFKINPDHLRIIIDPGHGGVDPGCTNSELSIVEKDINANIARLLLPFIQEKIPQASVSLTRTDDSFLGMQSRIQTIESLCKTNEQCVLISIHANTFPIPNVHGIELYYNKPNHPDSLSLVSEIAASIKTHIPETRFRGMKDRDLFVLKSNNIPGVLCELGFLSNEAEAKKLQTPMYQQKLAQSIATGVAQFVRNHYSTLLK